MPRGRPHVRVAAPADGPDGGARPGAGEAVPGEPPVAFLVTCEHGGNRIPPRYAALFRGRERLLATHRGYDPGALAMARTLARALRATLVVSTVSRLLVELNRSPGRQFLLSPVMRDAAPAVRDDVCRRYYVPYRARVESIVARAVGAGRRVVHVSSHSFAPALAGTLRSADVGLLYDPLRSGERDLCRRWQAALRARLPHWITRRNYPYAGRSDGFTRWLRRRFPERCYLGIELEINQKHVRDRRAVPVAQRSAVADALREAVSLTRV
jgi:predicted N-formylglutamate amidohydrolase